MRALLVCLCVCACATNIKPRLLAPIVKDWLRYKTTGTAFRRIDGRLTGTPADCCSKCAVNDIDTYNPNIPIAGGYRSASANHAYGLEGKAVLSDSDLESAIICVSGYAGSTTCRCRLDVAIYTDYHYLCENLSNDWWRYEGNTILTGGPYDKLTVDSVMLNLMFPWMAKDIMLWIHLFAVKDQEPCKIPTPDERHIEFVETRFDMSQYNYYFYPNRTITVPSAWTFVSETEHDDLGFWHFQEVGTMAHLEQGTSAP